jgi:hypothetical protein
MQVQRQNWHKIIYYTSFTLFSSGILMFSIDIVLHCKFYDENNLHFTSAQEYINFRKFNWFVQDLLSLQLILFTLVYLFYLIKSRQVAFHIELVFFLINLVLYVIHDKYMTIPYFI